MARVLEKQLFYRGIVEPSFGMSSLVKLNPNTLSETEKPLYSALKKHYRTKITTPTKEDILDWLEDHRYTSIERKEMGKVIKEIKASLPAADGKMVSEIVKTLIK